MEEPTPRQFEVFDHLFERTRKTGVQPTYREACAAFGFRSLQSVSLHVKALARKGWIAPHDGATGRRSIRFLRTPAGTPFRGFVLPRDDEDDPDLDALARHASVILLALRRLRRGPGPPWADADLMCARREWDAKLSALVAGLPPAYEPDGTAPVKI